MNVLTQITIGRYNSLEITIYQTLLRPWGYETPYTAIDDDGAIYNGFLPSEKITESDVMAFIEKQKLLKVASEPTVDELRAKKEALLAEVAEIDAKIEASDVEAVK